MALFPIDLLKTDKGIFGPSPAQGCFIRVSIAPFALNGETIETAARFDGIRLPDHDLQSLAGRSLIFPINPADGYIDGSIYINGAHHPIDVSEIRFGLAGEGMITASIICEIDFAFEGLGDFGKTPWTIDVTLRWDNEAQTA
jgi:hypothetical protein